MPVRRHPQQRHRAEQRAVVGNLRDAGHAHGRNDVVVGTFEFGAEVALVPELGAEKKRLERRADIALALLEALRHPRHQRWRRIIRHKVLREQITQVAGGGGSMGENVERFLARGDSRAAAVGAAEKELIAEVVAARVEVKAVRVALSAGQGQSTARPPRPPSTHPPRIHPSHPRPAHSHRARPHRALPTFLQAPSGKDMRKRGHVGLGVAAADAERVQLHHLARVVFVNTLEFASFAGTVGTAVLPVVEIEEHRGMPGRCAEQRAQAAHRMRPDCFLLVSAGPQMTQPLAGEDVEMVEPEGNHHLLQLAWPIDRAH